MALPNIALQHLNGDHKNLIDYTGKVVLVINVASHCGFTSQYRELQKLYADFKDRGFEILAFPCNQFGGQEPGSSDEIGKFCETNYGVSFPIFAKTDVNGPNSHPLFQFLKVEAPGILGTENIKWNFTKFLVSRSGQVVNRYASASSPESIRPEILKLL
jgi:glutathione peroxidase